MQEHRITVSRSARFHALGDLDLARDIWIVVHGYGQLASDFLAPFAPVVAPGRAVVAPEALNRYYKERAGEQTHSETPVGATWMTREDREAEIADYVAYLDAVAERVAPDGRRLTALGFSQGVATVTRWAAMGARRIDRLILWAGSLPRDLDLSAFSARLPTRALDVVIGTRDEYASWANVEEQRRAIESAGLALRLHSFEGGHRLDRKTLVALAEE